MSPLCTLASARTYNSLSSRLYSSSNCIQFPQLGKTTQDTMAPSRKDSSDQQLPQAYPAAVPGRGVQWHGLLLMDNFAAMNEAYDEFITSQPKPVRVCA
ncbi:hypothetical protein QBC45DRAFT_400202 [Copromyces sp. CBS 386.78]|nr:hypothetical protein QBC45DRAFT_400202 [Copromyces sp. CBS 386.78]